MGGHEPGSGEKRGVRVQQEGAGQVRSAAEDGEFSAGAFVGVGRNRVTERVKDFARHDEFLGARRGAVKTQVGEPDAAGGGARGFVGQKRSLEDARGDCHVGAYPGAVGGLADTRWQVDRDDEGAPRSGFVHQADDVVYARGERGAESGAGDAIDDQQGGSDLQQPVGVRVHHGGGVFADELIMRGSHRRTPVPPVEHGVEVAADAGGRQVMRGEEGIRRIRALAEKNERGFPVVRAGCRESFLRHRGAGLPHHGERAIRVAREKSFLEGA